MSEKVLFDANSFIDPYKGTMDWTLFHLIGNTF